MIIGGSSAKKSKNRLVDRSSLGSIKEQLEEFKRQKAIMTIESTPDQKSLN